MKEALEALPEQFRIAVLLADVEGFSYKEIAEILDIPIGTVMSRLHRGRKNLQKRLYEFATTNGLVARGTSMRLRRQSVEPVDEQSGAEFLDRQGAGLPGGPRGALRVPRR